MEKRNRWTDNKYAAFREWREKALKAILRQIEDAKPEAQKLEENWDRIKKSILISAKTITDIDSGTNTYSSRPLFVNSITGLIKRMAENGQAEHVRRAVELVREINGKHEKPIITEKNAIFELVTVAEEKQADNKALAERENKTFDFEGGKVIINYAIDRIQIKHEVKPNAEVITALKKSAFKWSPSQQVWQRQLTLNAQYATEKLTSVKTY